MNNTRTRQQVEDLLADYATGMLDVDTEASVCQDLARYPDLQAQAEELRIVRTALTRSAYNATVDTIAQRAAMAVGKRSKHRVAAGVAIAVALATAIVVLVVVPSRNDAPPTADIAEELALASTDDYAEAIDDIASDNMVNALLGVNDANERNHFLTDKDLDKILDDNNAP